MADQRMTRRIYIGFPILFLIILLINLLEIQSQILVNQYIRKITSNEGLSHNIVNDIVQDDNGFIWIATQDGLNRFDGYGFKTCQFDPADSTSISGNHIESLYFDRKNNL
jgi:ligand-binding sensor domain-containing protein